MFRVADLMLLSKTDLLLYLPEFSPQRAEQSLRNLASQAPILQFSARSGVSLEGWIDWLRAARQEHRRRLDSGTTMLPGEGTGNYRKVRATTPEIRFVVRPR